jgi:hypothetical protein
MEVILMMLLIPEIMTPKQIVQALRYCNQKIRTCKQKGYIDAIKYYRIKQLRLALHYRDKFKNNG